MIYVWRWLLTFICVCCAPISCKLNGSGQSSPSQWYFDSSKCLSTPNGPLSTQELGVLDVSTENNAQYSQPYTVIFSTSVYQQRQTSYMHTSDKKYIYMVLIKKYSALAWKNQPLWRLTCRWAAAAAKVRSWGKLGLAVADLRSCQSEASSFECGIHECILWNSPTRPFVLHMPWEIILIWHSTLFHCYFKRVFYCKIICWQNMSFENTLS